MTDLSKAGERPLDLTKAVKTRDGRAVRILCTDRKARYPVVGLISMDDREDMTSWDIDGHQFRNGETSQSDLVNVPQQRTVWLNVGAHGDTFPHATRERADNCAGDNRTARIRVTYIEGQFDD